MSKKTMQILGLVKAVITLAQIYIAFQLVKAEAAKAAEKENDDDTL